ncbi:hypothetical protein NEMBOFW57_010673 [Staphylotrichum longicolle]|uniref:Uncharacterized protein n=1 Tax=Staphylotrichum longicolle TaxID=669026 RepID=A0AAD4ERX1_9PEZI|nr:hypothetical protein NEMBOFW57_010673 [Staphylotrichum longicolle]
MVSFKAALVFVPALLSGLVSAAPTVEASRDLPVHAAETYKARLTCLRNYTGPSKSLTYEKVNDCRVMPYDTIGSIWIPDNIVCTFTVKPGDCYDTVGNFRSKTIFPPGLADIRQWYEPRKADFPGYWHHNARSIQCGGANF